MRCSGEPSPLGARAGVGMGSPSGPAAAVRTQQGGMALPAHAPRHPVHQRRPTTAACRLRKRPRLTGNLAERPTKQRCWSSSCRCDGAPEPLAGVRRGGQARPADGNAASCAAIVRVTTCSSTGNKASARLGRQVVLPPGRHLVVPGRALLRLIIAGPVLMFPHPALEPGTDPVRHRWLARNPSASTSPSTPCLPVARLPPREAGAIPRPKASESEVVIGL